jgi:hypothetical protein
MLFPVLKASPVASRSTIISTVPTPGLAARRAAVASAAGLPPEHLHEERFAF